MKDPVKKILIRIQQLLLWNLAHEYIASSKIKKRHTISIALAEEILSFGLCDLFDIELGYCDDDFRHGVMTVRIGRAWSNTKMSKEISDDDALLSHVIEEETQRGINSGKQRGINLEFDFFHIEYDAERRFVEITTFFKYKK